MELAYLAFPSASLSTGSVFRAKREKLSTNKDKLPCCRRLNCIPHRIPDKPRIGGQMIEDIATRRMIGQQIARPSFGRPSEVVRWLGAVQAQDSLAALWAVGLRMPGATEQAIEQALAERTIVRT